jgi:hypothetical protein
MFGMWVVMVEIVREERAREGMGLRKELKHKVEGAGVCGSSEKWLKNQ